MRRADRSQRPTLLLPPRWHLRNRDRIAPTIPKAVKDAAHRAIGCLMRMPAQALPDLDDAVRRLGRDVWFVGMAGPDSLWLTPATPAEIEEGPARIPLLGLLASHSDGHVREAAVVALAAAADDAALPFLLLRCTDWVCPVRSKAACAVRERLTQGNAAAFVGLLPLLRRFETVRRVDLSDLIGDIRRLLLREDGHAALLSGLQSGDVVLRREICRILNSLGSAPEAVALRLIQADRDMTVRLWLPTWERRLRASSPDRAAALRLSLSKDPAPRLRGAAIRAMIETDDPRLTARLEAALFDRSASIRDLARFHLRHPGAPIDFAALYRRALSDRSIPSTVAIAGLGETGAASDSALLLPLLSGRPREARAALKALARLDGEAQSGRILQALADERDGVCRDALRLLGRRVPEACAAELERLWGSAPTSASRRAIAEATRRLPPWPALPALLRALGRGTDQDAVIAALDRWRPEHRAYYAPRPPPELLRAPLRQALHEAAPVLPDALSDRLEVAFRG